MTTQLNGAEFGNSDDVKEYWMEMRFWFVPVVVVLLGALVMSIFRDTWYPMIVAAAAPVVGLWLRFHTTVLATMTLRERELDVRWEGNRIALPLTKIAEIGFGDGSYSRSSQARQWARDIAHPRFEDNDGGSRFVVVRLDERTRGIGVRFAVPYASPHEAARAVDTLRQLVRTARADPYR